MELQINFVEFLVVLYVAVLTFKHILKIINNIIFICLRVYFGVFYENYPFLETFLNCFEKFKSKYF